MKRFMLFAAPAYYPSGGMNDFVDSFDTFEEAITKGESLLNDKIWYIAEWYHVYDIVENKMVKEVG